MYPIVIPSRHTSPMGVTTTAAFAVLGSVFTLVGTGTIFDLNRAENWRMRVQHSTPLVIDVDPSIEDADKRPDLRTAAEHLANIRMVLNPAIADMALVLGVSRQAIYKWIGGDATPESDKFERIRILSRAADAFHKAGVTRAATFLKMKVFNGRSLMDLVSTGELTSKQVETLIAEAHVMESSYDRSGLARSKAKPTTDWQAQLSIPGSPE